MKSTGEVMGGADNFGAAFGKAMMGAGQRLPEKGCVFISVNNSDKPTVLPIARDLAQLGFTLAATRGTAAFLRAHGLEVEVMYKVNEGRPNVADHLVNRSIDLVINTPLGRDSFFDDRAVRRAATMAQVPCITTLTGASAAVSAIKALRSAGADRALAAGLLRRGRSRSAKAIDGHEGHEALRRLTTDSQGGRSRSRSRRAVRVRDALTFGRVCRVLRGLRVPRWPPCRRKPFRCAHRHRPGHRHRDRRRTAG